MSNPEVVQVIQRQINNGQYSDAVDSINIVCSQPGTVILTTVVLNTVLTTSGLTT